MKKEGESERWGRRPGGLLVFGSVSLLVSSLTVIACGTLQQESRHTAPIVLSQENVMHQDLYVARCDRCHEEMPDPAEPYCFSDVSAEDHLAIWEYEMAMLEGDPLYSAAGKALFEATCVGCHDLPDPSQPGCFSGVSGAEVIPLHVYMENSRRGKETFEGDCRSCHPALDPSAHDLEFWSAHLCNADQHLTPEQEQRVLLFLAVRAEEERT
jgi:cytochrome c5